MDSFCMASCAQEAFNRCIASLVRGRQKLHTCTATLVVILLDLSLLSLLIVAPVLAAPILAPDLANECSRILYDVPEYVDSMNCCAPKWDRPPIGFRFDESVSRSHLRVRKPAHTADPEFAEKLNRGYQLMKALPPEDPRSFYQQANIHCAYCDEAYVQSNGKPLQVHESWLFFPFHRWYLYFHERILAKLLQDDSFALPFWNYDHPNGSCFPRIFMDYPGLNDSLRDPSHLFPHIVSFRSCDGLSTCDEPTPEENMQIMHRVMISGAKRPSLFFGKSYRLGDDRMPGGGTAEMIVHNNVHLWIGDNKRRWLEDMGTFYSSARDPVFYAHHASLDRLWEEWKTIEGHKEYEDPDYLDSEFVFYNENAELIKVKVRDSVDVEKLGYTYEKAENLWLNARPPSTRGRTPNGMQFATLCTAGEALQQPCFLMIRRHQHIPLETEEEILVIEGIRVLHSTRPARFDVFVNLRLAYACPMLNCTEYAGSFTSVPQLSSGKDEWRGRTLRLGIGFIVQALQLSSEHRLRVTMVPTRHPHYSRVKLEGRVFVEYENSNANLASI